MDNIPTALSATKGWRTDSKVLYRALIISLCTNILIIILYAGKKVYNKNFKVPQQVIIPPNDSMVTYTYNKIKSDANAYELFKILPNDTTDIVFLGNSLTSGFFLQEMFQNVHLKNRGIGGNTSVDILHRLDEVTEGKPRKIFLEIGINDISQGININILLNNVKRVAALIKEQTPQTKLYIHSVFPTAFQYKILMPRIQEYNNLLKDFCEKNSVKFINLYPVFYKGDGLDTSLTIDGIHLNGKGYLVWKKKIEKYVQ